MVDYSSVSCTSHSAIVIDCITSWIPCNWYIVIFLCCKHFTNEISFCFIIALFLWNVLFVYHFFIFHCITNIFIGKWVIICECMCCYFFLKRVSHVFIFFKHLRKINFEKGRGCIIKVEKLKGIQWLEKNIINHILIRILKSAVCPDIRFLIILYNFIIDFIHKHSLFCYVFNNSFIIGSPSRIFKWVHSRICKWRTASSYNTSDIIFF